MEDNKIENTFEDIKDPLEEAFNSEPFLSWRKVWKDFGVFMRSYNEKEN